MSWPERDSPHPFVRGPPDPDDKLRIDLFWLGFGAAANLYSIKEKIDKTTVERNSSCCPLTDCSASSSERMQRSKQVIGWYFPLTACPAGGVTEVLKLEVKEIPMLVC